MYLYIFICKCIIIILINFMIVTIYFIVNVTRNLPDLQPLCHSLAPSKMKQIVTSYNLRIIIIIITKQTQE